MRSLSAAVCFGVAVRAVMLQFGDAVVEPRNLLVHRGHLLLIVGDHLAHRLLVLRYLIDVRLRRASGGADRHREQPHEAQSELAVIEHARRRPRYC